MSPVKTRGFSLRILPYRESSSIVYVYTEELGLVHGVAKGIRRRSKGSEPVERGTMVEVMVYIRPHRSMHTLGSIDVLEFYPGVRTDLLRSALRDAAFETTLKSLHPEEPNRELFDLLSELMLALESSARDEAAAQRLWRFYVQLAGTLGFGLDLGSCALCRDVIGGHDGAVLLVDRGGVACSRCAGPPRASTSIPGDILHILRGEAVHDIAPLSPQRQRSITRALARYCYHHADVHDDGRALDFLCEMFGESPAEKRTG